MTIKRIAIPKIPQNLTIEQVAPILNKLRHALSEIQTQALNPIDGNRLIFGTVTESELRKDLLIDVKATRYYIEPINGTSIKNSSGSLTIRAVRVDGFGTTALTAGAIKMFKPDGTLAGNGYEWTATAGDINDSIIITLRHQTELTEWDTITLVDITDGGSAVIGAVDATNGLVWTRAIDSGAWTPGTTTTDLTATFYLLGASIATRIVRVTLNTGDGTLTASLQSSNGEPTTHSIDGSGTTSLSVSFQHTDSGATVIESVFSVQGGDSGVDGDDAVFFYIKPIGGTAIHNGAGNLTIEAHRVTGGTDILLSSGTIQLFDPGNNIVNVANGYVTGSDGYTGVLDSGDIANDIIITLKDGTGGTVLDTITLVDIADGLDGSDAVYGFIEPENGLAWTRATNQGAWTPSQLTTDLDTTFVQGGAIVAKIARRITLTSADGTLASTTIAHKDADLNTSRVTVTVSGGASTAITVSFDYSFGGDDATVVETVGSVQGGGSGDFIDIKFQRSSTVPATPTGDNPAGWTDTIPSGSDALYEISGSKTFDGTLIGVWSAPRRIQGLVFRGPYSAGLAYLPDDFVTFSERSYICTVATTGNPPSGTNSSNAFWDLLAGKGDTGDPPTPFVETIVVPAGPQNLRNLANAHTPAYDGIADATVTFTVANGITCTGNADGGVGIDTGVWPSGSATIVLTLENDGIIRGGGGAGGGGGEGSGANGQDGGDAINCQEDITIDNAPAGPGLIEASGGGGGGGAGGDTGGQEPLDRGGGGGGGGFPNGNGGLGANVGGPGNGSDGANGTTGGGGTGGASGGGDAADGGNGGNVNGDGSNGINGGRGSGGIRGVRGFAVRKNGHTVPVTGGTVTGQQG